MRRIVDLFRKKDYRKRIHFDVATHTDAGNRRLQEDAVGFFRNDKAVCCVLCDGLGGHGMGDVASELVVSTFEKSFHSTIMDLSGFLPHAFNMAQNNLLQKQACLHASERIKTTAVAIVADERKAYIGHIGDSRLYVFHRKRIVSRTLDHSIPQMLVLSHTIKESEIRNHPDRNVVLRVLGTPWDEPQYELIKKAISIGSFDAFLLCSDGFWELINEKEMELCLNQASNANEWLEKMVAIVQKNGRGIEMDNNSAIAIICYRV